MPPSEFLKRKMRFQIMTSTPKYQSPRRLGGLTAKAKPATPKREEALRNAMAKSAMQSDRRRGWHRGARR